MREAVRSLSVLALSTAILFGFAGRLLYGQEKNDPNTVANPYRMEELSVQLPNGRKLGAPIGVEIDHSDGKNTLGARALRRRHLRRFDGRPRDEAGR